MKYIFLFKFIIYWTCSIYAQKNINSIYFEYPESNDFTTQKVLPSKFYGDFFKLHDSLINLKLDSNGIFIFHNVVFPIPKEEMKVLQTYIKEDSIYGIKSNKGLPFKSINDTIYALLSQQYPIYSNDSLSSFMVFEDQVFLFNKTTDTLHTVIKLSLHQDTLFLVESDPSIFSDSIISNVHLINHLNPYYLLSKSEKKWKTFIKNKGFNDTTLYLKK